MDYTYVTKMLVWILKYILIVAVLLFVIDTKGPSHSFLPASSLSGHVSDNLSLIEMCGISKATVIVDYFLIFYSSQNWAQSMNPQWVGRTFRLYQWPLIYLHL